MSEVQISDFSQFFFDLNGKPPFPWQERLAQRVCAEGWPSVIDLPTASGKTACVDIALFALAARGGEAPRRIFFVVDRRVIVSEVVVRAKRIMKSLEKAETESLKRVAGQLRRIAGGDKPLKAYELRGGAYRDEAWVDSPLQPLVVASTVDQVGSRLLFRGYGVSENSWPLHAGLIANDALVFLDEAHCSKAFAQTLQAIAEYRGDQWTADSIGRPFHFVEMTATPVLASAEHDRFQITDEDRKPEFLGERIYAEKPTALIEIKCRKEDGHKFAAALVAEALRVADEASAKRVVIMVNRVQTAKAAYERLREKDLDTLLVIGRMRPIDRDRMQKEWEPLKAGVVKRSAEEPRKFVVSTQCLEVGADLDFDVLVSECASIDALRQRFGRLDRLGQFQRARGSIVVASWQLTGREHDPVYGEALQKTWHWLQEIGTNDMVNMSIESKSGEMRTVAEHWQTVSADDKQSMQMQGENAPYLLPAHLDALVQTSPRPEPEPLIELFLHGPKHSVPDVQVVWRGDLDGAEPDEWPEIVALCPPSSMEAMPVSITAFQKWFTGKASTDESDLEIAARSDEVEESAEYKRSVLIWRGTEDSAIARSATEIRPGDTLVLPTSTKAWKEFGYKPEAFQEDIGDQARFGLRRGICLRLQPSLLNEWPPTEARDDLKKLVGRDGTEDETWALLRILSKEGLPEWCPPIEDWAQPGSLSRYPDGSGYVLEGRISKQGKGKTQVLLREHLDHVADEAERVTGDLIAPGLKKALITAARFHDYGKADVRYQAWLRGGDVLAAQYAPKPLAKSGRNLTVKQTECGLPPGFRHEVLSLLFAAKGVDPIHGTRDLILHLIASHHGRCRPFAPVAIDNSATCLTFEEISICREERVGEPQACLTIEAADRFWNLTRQYGWWGLAYLEALLRLADWKASDNEGAEVSQ